MSFEEQKRWMALRAFLPKRAWVMGRQAPGSSPTSAVPSDSTQASVEEADSLNQIAAELNGCTRCGLCRNRTHVVVGEGHSNADLVFVGEGPGEQEDRQGRPFVGRAGQLLNRMIEAIGLRREDVHILNVVKCRPPQNRNPQPEEIATCSPFLNRQLSVIHPKVIMPLGKFAAQTLLSTEKPISKLRGRVFAYQGIEVIPSYHPAFLLRNPGSKREAWEDLKQVAGKLGLQIPKRGRHEQ